MKKYTLGTLTFGALIHSGVFATTETAANEAHADSSASFSEADGDSTALSFTDSAGMPQVATTGDALKETFDTDGTTFIGWTLVPAAEVAEWAEALDDQDDAADKDAD